MQSKMKSRLLFGTAAPDECDVMNFAVHLMLSVQFCNARFVGAFRGSEHSAGKSAGPVGLAGRERHGAVQLQTERQTHPVRGSHPGTSACPELFFEMCRRENISPFAHVRRV